jgi:hypothetical protein
MLYQISGVDGKSSQRNSSKTYTIAVKYHLTQSSSVVPMVDHLNQFRGSAYVSRSRRLDWTNATQINLFIFVLQTERKSIASKQEYWTSCRQRYAHKLTT